MCGIVGYVGDRPAQAILLDCLRKLEYRGYDSCGIAVASDAIRVSKDAVRVDALAKAAPVIAGTTGIGHTRWATHGRPSQVNAHPHLDCSGRIAVVHNGVISNYAALRAKLTAEGHRFVSETDTEVMPHLVEKYYKGDLLAAVEAALAEVEGSYAFIVMAEDKPELVVARRDSPVIIGAGDRGNFVSSDVPALLDYTNRVVYLEDGDVALVTAQRVRVRHSGSEVERKEQKVLWTVAEAQRGGYDHFMLKEIHEQPRVIRNTLAEYPRVTELVADWPLMDAGPLLLACGTSYHAALVGRHVFEELAGTPTRVELASELNYYRRVAGRGLAIAITQSGETADTLKAMRRVRDTGAWMIAVTNVVGSSASRIANQTIYTNAGPEISVAATKSFTAQLVVLYMLAMSAARVRPDALAGLTAELRRLPTRVQQVLDDEATIAAQAHYLSEFDNVFYVARGLSLPVAMEGALKLKEISYIHAEARSAGEMKHGPLALLSARTPLVAIVERDATYEAMLTNIKEIKARGAPVIAVAEEGDDTIGELVDAVIAVPRVEPLFSPVVNAVALQLLAYHTARERGCPIDFPRTLAKSVTVE